MKLFKKIFLGLALAFVAVITLASCSNVSESYANKVTKAAEKGENITYTQVVADLGNECFDVTVGKTDEAKTGFILGVKGYTNDMTKEELVAKLQEANADTKFEYLLVVVALGKCTGARYLSGTANEIKTKLGVK